MQTLSVFKMDKYLSEDFELIVYMMQLDESGNEIISKQKLSIDKIVQNDLYIFTVADLKKIQEYVNLGATYEGKTMYLMRDLDLSSVCSQTKGSWTPIGKYVSQNEWYAFKGTFEGNNHTISNLYINSSNEFVGLFGVLQNSTINDLNVRGSVITTGNHAGILAGGMIDGTVRNITVNPSSVVTGQKYVAGIIGNCSGNCSISYSINYAKVQASNEYSAGISGNLDSGRATRCINKGEVIGTKFVGGITGRGGTILECGNTGNITGSVGYIGGIAGGESYKLIAYCYNRGNIKGYGNDGTGFTSVGGIAGSQYTVTYCYNTGNIYGSLGQVGGIIGNIYGSQINISYCYNTGNISGNGRAIGSIVGECLTSTASNCYWTSEQDCRGYRGTDTNCYKVSESYLKTYRNAKLKSDYTQQINSGFPILYWE